MWYVWCVVCCVCGPPFPMLAGIARKAGEEWLVSVTGSYLPAVEEQVKSKRLSWPTGEATE